MQKLSITIILASYNEEENIKNTLMGLYNELIKHNEINFEILAYNDCSTDKTGEIIDSMTRKMGGIVPVHNKKNLGLGGILKDGIKKSNKEKIMLLPGDGQFKFDEIPYLIKQSTDTDILITFHKNYYIRTLKRRFFSFVFHHIVKILFNIPYKYLNWLHIYDKKIFKKIKITSNRFTFSAEIIIKAHKLGYKIKETGSYLKDRERGKSSAIKVSSIIDALFSIIKLWIEIYIKERRLYGFKF